MMTKKQVLLIPWLLAFCISAVSSQSRGRYDYSCTFQQEGQPVDGPCGQRCICLDGRLSYCCRVRKDFPSMTREERLRYVNTVIKASTDPEFRDEYNEIIGTHKQLFDKGIHNKKEFLPWHRWFLLLFENLLQRVDCQVTLPYWDWSLFSGSVWRTGEDDIWSSKPWGLGGNGKRNRRGEAGCVPSGRFRSSKWQQTPSAKEGRKKNCLRREFSARAPDIIAVFLTKSHSPREFHEFELDVRANLHDTFHCRVGGTMCDHNSANAPEFFLHHAHIDKIWADWQAKSVAHLEAYFPHIRRNYRMKKARFHPRAYIDTLYMPHPNRNDRSDIRICVLYQDPVHPLYNEIMSRLEKLSTRRIQRIPRRYFRPATWRQLRRLGVKKAERRKARKLLKKELEPRIRVRSKQLTTLYEKMLGFRLEHIPFSKFKARDSPSRNTSLMHDRWLAKSNKAAEMHSSRFEIPRFANISSTMV